MASNLIDEFLVTEVLNSNTSNKSVTLLGKIKDTDAILVVTKRAFGSSIDDFKNIKSVISQLKQLENNDIYYWNVATLEQDLETSPAAKADLIFPATATHIKKYRRQYKRVVTETPDMYHRYVEPYIKTQLGDRIKWVYNILFEGAEADRVVYRNDDAVNGFVLVPDMKWDRKTMTTMYLVAIVMRKDLYSIRSLNASHTSFLTSMKSEILAAVKDQFGLGPHEVKLYLHYQPSYYHLHVHVAHVDFEQSDFGRSLLLDNIIDQLQYLGPEGFSKSTLSYIIGTGHDLWQKFENGSS